MKTKRRRLRLRKQVIVTIPIILLLITTFSIVLINKNKNLKNEANVVKIETADSLEITDNNSVDNTDNTTSYLTTLSEAIYKRKRDNTIIYYAQKFKMNIDKTLELAYNFTNNFTAEDYLQNFVIGPEKVKLDRVSFPSEEAGIAFFVRDIYRYPGKYGTTSEEIRTTDAISTERTRIDGKIYVDNGMTYEQYLGKICDLFQVDKNIILAISYMESGYTTSNLFNNKNNIGGHRGYSGWMSYPTLEAGIIAHVLTVKAIADNHNIDTNTDSAIELLSSIYVNGHPNDPDAHWTNKVTIITNQIKEKDLFTIK